MSVNRKGRPACRPFALFSVTFGKYGKWYCSTVQKVIKIIRIFGEINEILLNDKNLTNSACYSILSLVKLSTVMRFS